MEKYQNRDTAELIQTEMLTAENVNAVSEWSNAVMVEEIDPFSADRYPALNVECRDGEVKRASLGDYVVMHRDGVFDVFSPIMLRAGYTQEYL